MVLLEDFQLVLSRSGGRAVGSRYYGVWDRYPFSAQVSRTREPGVVSFEFRLNASLENALFRELKKSLPKGCRLLAAGGSTYRMACSGRPLRECDLSLGSILSALTRAFQSAGISPSDVCPVCRQTGCDAYADVGGYTAVHRACVEGMAESTRARAETALRSGSYVTGFIGALIGGLVACIPTLLAYYAGWMVAYLYALIPLGAYYGYKLFRGRMSGGAFVCTCIVSVLHLFTMEQIIFYFYVHNYYNIWPSIFATFSMYWDIMSFGDVLADMGMSAVFMALGLWISWGRIRRTAYTDAVSAVSARSTLMNRNPFLY